MDVAPPRTAPIVLVVALVEVAVTGASTGVDVAALDAEALSLIGILKLFTIIS